MAFFFAHLMLLTALSMLLAITVLPVTAAIVFAPGRYGVRMVGRANCGNAYHGFWRWAGWF